MKSNSWGQDDDDGCDSLGQSRHTEGQNASVPLSGIAYPGQNDVKFGRGGDTNYHIGNSRFRYFVNQYKQRYQAASREERQTMVQEIVHAWRSQDPPGRFVARSGPGSGHEGSYWHDVGDKVASKKTIKLLGEGLGSKRRTTSDSSSSSQAPKRMREPCVASVASSSTGSITVADSTIEEWRMNQLAARVEMEAEGPVAWTNPSTLRSMSQTPSVPTAPTMQEAAITLSNHGMLRPSSAVGESKQSQMDGAEVSRCSESTGYSSEVPFLPYLAIGFQQSLQDVLPVAASLTNVFNGSGAGVNNSHSSDSQDS